MTSRFAAQSTVSVHSVSSRTVTQGTPSQYASRWMPPESVTTAPAWRSRAMLSRYPTGAVIRTRPFAAYPSRSSAAPVRGCAAKRQGSGEAARPSMTARNRAESSTSSARCRVTKTNRSAAASGRGVLSRARRSTS
ncbi:MAG: hypothetical protein AUI57_01835 [Candidatus Rokubacteria bacterium 13_1_40CM_2_68_8]|nr:MAG: hypothetical protein AUI57_01835 [Candidatus Rokubacteria bacterium 13_1_40CM_2_68_8]